MAKFSKSHYIQLQAALIQARQHDNSPGYQVSLYCAHCIADVLERDNPAFDRSHFMDVVQGREIEGKPDSCDGRKRCV